MPGPYPASFSLAAATPKGGTIAASVSWLRPPLRPALRRDGEWALVRRANRRPSGLRPPAAPYLSDSAAASAGHAQRQDAFQCRRKPAPRYATMAAAVTARPSGRRWHCGREEPLCPQRRAALTPGVARAPLMAAGNRGREVRRTEAGAAMLPVHSKSHATSGRVHRIRWGEWCWQDEPLQGAGAAPMCSNRDDHPRDSGRGRHRVCALGWCSSPGGTGEARAEGALWRGGIWR